MGTNKLLLPFAGGTVLGHILDVLSRSDLEGIYAVLGYQAQLVTRQIADYPVTIVHNNDYQADMLSSIRCGLAALPLNCDKILLVLGDQPNITTVLINQIILASNTTDKKILVPLYQGRHGHPLLFSTFFRPEIMTTFDDVGLRGLLARHSHDVFELNVSSPAVLSDMDYPDDYRRELEFLNTTPTNAE